MIFTIIGVCSEGASVNGDYGFLTSITTMELFDQFEIPMFLAAMVAIELKLVSFTLIVLLELNSCIVAVFSFEM